MVITYTSIDQIKEANKKRGHTWFSIDTVNYHGSKIETDVIGGYCFVESSYRALGEPDSGRVYRVASASPDGTVQYLHGGTIFTTVEEAIDYIAAVTASE